MYIPVMRMTDPDLVTERDVRRTAKDKPVPGKRIGSLDFFRGLIMIVMALDHARDFFCPTKLIEYGAHLKMADSIVTYPLLFYTRWVTDFCAPGFFLLVGIGSFLHGSKAGRTRRDTQFFLFKRGVWLLFVEIVIVSHFGWLGFHSNMVFLQVIWALGWAMILLSLVIALPKEGILALGILFTFFSFPLKNIAATGTTGFLMSFIYHSLSSFKLGTFDVNIVYTILPWAGLPMIGFCMGDFFKKEKRLRIQFLYTFGVLFLVLFCLLRLNDQIGNINDWSRYGQEWFTLNSFLNVNKYPPSVTYILLTLGVNFVLLASVELTIKYLPRQVVVFGSVPFLFYVFHLAFLRYLAIIYNYFAYGVTSMEPWWFLSPDVWPEGYHENLAIVYIAWVVTIICLYPVCAAFSRFKATHKDQAWLGYL